MSMNPTSEHGTPRDAHVRNVWLQTEHPPTADVGEWMGCSVDKQRHGYQMASAVSAAYDALHAIEAIAGLLHVSAEEAVFDSPSFALSSAQQAGLLTAVRLLARTRHEIDGAVESERREAQAMAGAKDPVQP